MYEVQSENIPAFVDKQNRLGRQRRLTAERGGVVAV